MRWFDIQYIRVLIKYVGDNAIFCVSLLIISIFTGNIFWSRNRLIVSSHEHGRSRHDESGGERFTNEIRDVVTTFEAENSFSLPKCVKSLTDTFNAFAICLRRHTYLCSKLIISIKKTWITKSEFLNGKSWRQSYS